MADRDMLKKTVFLIYDADTAAGTNNEGALVFSPFLEDIDHLESGADIFNGQKSVLWVNLRQAFFEEIKSMYKALRSSGALSYTKVERMFEGHQGKWPEAIFNEDSWFKYLAPLVEKGNATYLSMLQGSKECQRKWWLYNRFKYLDSKYNAGDSLNDFIELRGYAKGDITVTPYAGLYASVRYGSYLVQSRAEAGGGSTLPCPLDSVNDTEIILYSASQLKLVGDLSPLKVGRANFSNARKIQEIKLGDGDASYSNGNLTELTLGNNTMLRRLDLRNCPNLVAPLDVSQCTNIEELYLDGTAVTGLMLPNGGILKKLHVPASLANLTIRNQGKITEFSMPDYSGISTLRLENVGEGVPSMEILDALREGARVRLVGFHWEFDDTDAVSAFYDKLDGYRGLDGSGGNLDKAQVSGTIHIPFGEGNVLATLKERYPYLVIHADHTRSTLRYWTFDGSEMLDSEVIEDGGNGTRTNTTARESTLQYDFTPNGWATRPDGNASADALIGIVADRNVYAAYDSTIRTYDVRFVRSSDDGGGVLYTQKGVPYGTVPAYGGATPTTTLGSAGEYPFEGWTPALEPVDGTNLTYTAAFGNPFLIEEISDSWDQVFAAIENGTYKSRYKIGQYKQIDTTNENKRFVAQIIDFDKDVDNGGSPVPITFASKDLSDVALYLRTTGPDDNALRVYGTSEGYAIMPDDIKARMVQIKKNRIVGRSNNLTENVHSWVFSKAELARGYKLFDSNKHRIRAYNDIATQYWTRDSSGYGNVGSYWEWWAVSEAGAITRYSGGTRRLLIGFTLGTYEQSHLKNVTWEQVLDSIEAGTYGTDFAVGDIIPLRMTDGTVLNAEIVGFDPAEGQHIKFVTYRLCGPTAHRSSWYGTSEVTEEVDKFKAKMPAELSEAYVVQPRVYSGYDIPSGKKKYNSTRSGYTRYIINYWARQEYNEASFSYVKPDGGSSSGNLVSTSLYFALEFVL